MDTFMELVGLFTCTGNCGVLQERDYRNVDSVLPFGAVLNDQARSCTKRSQTTVLHLQCSTQIILVMKWKKSKELKAAEQISPKDRVV